MKNEYSIFLNNKKIGITELAKADVPMGVVFGEIEFSENFIDYDFLKAYCKSKNIELVDDYPEDKLVTTMTIDSLTVKN